MVQPVVAATSTCQRAKLIDCTNFLPTSSQSARTVVVLSRYRGSLVFFWFVGTAVASVWCVFRDPKFAYRWVIAGALVPMFSVVMVVGVLAAVMLLTIDQHGTKKATRRNWLALTMGVFFHLVFDGAFLSTKMFWWPVAGFSTEGYVLPLVERGLLNIPFEIFGIWLIVWTKKQVKPLL